MLFKLEYFDRVYLHFHQVFLTLFAYICMLINQRSEIFVDNLETRLSIFVQLIVAF